MDVLARTLSVHNYRSFEEFDVELDPDITILIGRNAVGKTNLIESVQLLTAGQSFRRPTASQLVRNGEGTCRIDLSFTGRGTAGRARACLFRGKEELLFKRQTYFGRRDAGLGSKHIVLPRPPRYDQARSFASQGCARRFRHSAQRSLRPSGFVICSHRRAAQQPAQRISRSHRLVGGIGRSVGTDGRRPAFPSAVATRAHPLAHG